MLEVFSFIFPDAISSVRCIFFFYFLLVQGILNLYPVQNLMQCFVFRPVSILKCQTKTAADVI